MSDVSNLVFYAQSPISVISGRANAWYQDLWHNADFVGPCRQELWGGHRWVRKWPLSERRSMSGERSSHLRLSVPTGTHTAAAQFISCSQHTSTLQPYTSLLLHRIQLNLCTQHTSTLACNTPQTLHATHLHPSTQYTYTLSSITPTP